MESNEAKPYPVSPPSPDSPTGAPYPPWRRPFTIAHYTTEAEQLFLNSLTQSQSTRNPPIPQPFSLYLPPLSTGEKVQLDATLASGQRFIPQPSVDCDFPHGPAIHAYWSREPETENVVPGFRWESPPFLLFYLLLAVAAMMALLGGDDDGGNAYARGGGVLFDAVDDAALDGAAGIAVVDGVVQVGVYSNGTLVVVGDGDDDDAGTTGSGAVVEVDRWGAPRVSEEMRQKRRESDEVFRRYRREYDRNFPPDEGPVVTLIG